MNPRFLSLCAGLLAAVTTTTTRADAIRRLNLDGTSVGADLTKLAIPGKPNPDNRPLNPILELYPTTVKPAKGTVLLSPGGGYNHLSAVHEGANVARLLNEAGWDVAMLLYHVDAGPDTRALALDDARKAFSLVRTRGGEFGLSTQRIGAMGFSAGGHLTVRLANETLAAGAAPAFLVLIYPAYLERGGKLQDNVAPIAVPTFLCVGDQDKAWYPSSVAYAAACKEKNIPCEYIVIPGAGHGFGFKPDQPEGVREWTEKLKAFLAALPAEHP